MLGADADPGKEQAGGQADRAENDGAELFVAGFLYRPAADSPGHHGVDRKTAQFPAGRKAVHSAAE